MKTDLFDFDLPKERIALRRGTTRSGSRMLRVDETGEITHHHFHDLFRFLNAGDCLVLNDTKVIKARLNGVVMTEGRSAKSEFTIIKIRKSSGELIVNAFARGAKKFRIGELVFFGEGFTAKLTEKNLETGELTLAFELPSAEEFFKLCDQYGAMPLPPYIASTRKPDARDESDYQTVFAEKAGSVAAPTASLHFDQDLLNALTEKGVKIAKLTLHVGAGTFLPVKSENIADHKMHSEYFILDENCARMINETKQNGGKVIAAGTTAMRTLESCAVTDTGESCAVTDTGESCAVTENNNAVGRVTAKTGETDIFITPGFQFNITDRLITNFHLPRSTLFMLVCAFSGIDTMKRAYGTAIENQYGFFSYGDACFLEPAR